MKSSDARMAWLDAFSAVNCEVVKSHSELEAKKERLHALGEIQASLMEKKRLAGSSRWNSEATEV